MSSATIVRDAIGIQLHVIANSIRGEKSVNAARAATVSSPRFHRATLRVGEKFAAPLRHTFRGAEWPDNVRAIPRCGKTATNRCNRARSASEKIVEHAHAGELRFRQGRRTFNLRRIGLRASSSGNQFGASARRVAARSRSYSIANVCSERRLLLRADQAADHRHRARGIEHMHHRLAVMLGQFSPRCAPCSWSRRQ